MEDYRAEGEGGWSSSWMSTNRSWPTRIVHHTSTAFDLSGDTIDHPSRSMQPDELRCRSWSSSTRDCRRRGILSAVAAYPLAPALLLSSLVARSGREAIPLEMTPKRSLS